MQSKIVYYRYGEILIDNVKNDFDDRRDRTIPKNIYVPIYDYYIKRYSSIPNNLIILEVIKQSGKNTVLRALDTNLKCSVYLKEAAYLSNIDIYGTDSLDRLEIEKRVLLKTGTLSFTPKLLGEFYVGEHYFIEIEEIKAKNLLEFMRENIKICLKEKVEIILKIAEKLKKLLRLGIIYIDLSFSNIMIDKNYRIYFIDFEYCKIKDEWNPPDIIAGCIGFYDPQYIKVDENRIIFALAALLLYMEYFDIVKSIFDTDSEELILNFLKYDFYKKSIFSDVYQKAFSNNFCSLSDLESSIMTILNTK